MMLSTLFVSALLAGSINGQLRPIPQTLRPFAVLDAVGSLGRVGNPFEVPVGMRGEQPAFVPQMTRLARHLHVVSGVSPALVFRNNSMYVEAAPKFGFMARTELTLTSGAVTHSFFEGAQTVLSAVLAPGFAFPSVFAAELIRAPLRTATIPASFHAAFQRKESGAAVAANGWSFGAAALLYHIDVPDYSIHAASAAKEYTT